MTQLVKKIQDVVLSLALQLKTSIVNPCPKVLPKCFKELEKIFIGKFLTDKFVKCNGSKKTWQENFYTPNFTPK